MSNLIRNRIVLAGAIIALMVAGCNRNKSLTRANYDKITSGMALAEVEKLLGGPGEQEGGDLGLAEGSGVAGAAGIGGDLGSMSQPRSKDKIYKWGNDTRWIKVTLRDGKVAQGTFKTEEGLK
jgi:hypothetical protein